jgi:hypothetical protein
MQQGHSRADGASARLRPVVIAALLFVLAPGVAPAAPSEDLPPALHATLALRLVAYDHRIARRPGSPVTLLVLGQDAAGARQVAEALENAARGAPLAGRPVRVTSAVWKSADDLKALFEAQRPEAVLVPASLDDAAAAIAQVTRARSVLSIASSAAALRAGLGLAVVRRGVRPGILINLAAAKAEGAELDAALLELSERVEEAPR